VQRPDLPEFIAEMARPRAEFIGSAGGVEKTPWPLYCQSSAVCAAGKEEAAMTSSCAAQSITGQRADAAVDEQEVETWAWVMEAQALATID
jgi:hypothetical protein